MPRCSYIRRVWGCMPSSSAATPIMYLGVVLLTSAPPRRSCEQRLADVGAAVERGVLLERLALLPRELLGHLDAQPHEQVALLGVGAADRGAAALHPQPAAVPGAAR